MPRQCLARHDRVEHGHALLVLGTAAIADSQFTHGDADVALVLILGDDLQLGERLRTVLRHQRGDRTSGVGGPHVETTTGVGVELAPEVVGGRRTRPRRLARGGEDGAPALVRATARGPPHRFENRRPGACLSPVVDAVGTTQLIQSIRVARVRRGTELLARLPLLAALACLGSDDVSHPLGHGVVGADEVVGSLDTLSRRDENEAVLDHDDERRHAPGGAIGDVRDLDLVRGVIGDVVLVGQGEVEVAAIGVTPGTIGLLHARSGDRGRGVHDRRVTGLVVPVVAECVDFVSGVRVDDDDPGTAEFHGESQRCHRGDGLCGLAGGGCVGAVGSYCRRQGIHGVDGTHPLYGEVGAGYAVVGVQRGHVVVHGVGQVVAGGIDGLDGVPLIIAEALRVCVCVVVAKCLENLVVGCLENAHGRVIDSIERGDDVLAQCRDGLAELLGDVVAVGQRSHVVGVVRARGVHGLAGIDLRQLLGFDGLAVLHRVAEENLRVVRGEVPSAAESRFIVGFLLPVGAVVCGEFGAVLDE